MCYNQKVKHKTWRLKVKLNMGIIGCGTHALHHVKHYKKHFDTYGVWDPNPLNMLKFDGIKFSSLEELLANVNIQAVMICSPDEFHLDQIRKALIAGKHVFCEKPLIHYTDRMSELEDLFRMAINRNLAFTTCHPRRFDRPFIWLNEQLHALWKKLGKVISFDFDFSYHEPSNKWKRDRSLLLDHMNHEVDLMNALFGIQTFYGMNLVDSFYRYEVVGKREDGITFHFRGTRRLQTHAYPEWCRVRFERGEVELDMMCGLATISNHDKKTLEVVPGLSIDYDGRLEKVMEDFAVNQIGKGKPGYLSISEMLMNSEVGIKFVEYGVQQVRVRKVSHK